MRPTYNARLIMREDTFITVRCETVFDGLCRSLSLPPKSDSSKTRTRNPQGYETNVIPTEHPTLQHATKQNAFFVTLAVSHFQCGRNHATGLAHHRKCSLQQLCDARTRTPYQFLYTVSNTKGLWCLGTYYMQKVFGIKMNKSERTHLGVAF